MSTEHLYFNNIDNSATVESLTEALLQLWPNVFLKPYQDGDLVVRVYKYEKGTTAVAYNVSVDYEEMMLDAEGQRLLGRVIKVKPDTGETRDPSTGVLMEKMSGLAHRHKLAQYGESSRKVTGVFKQSFLHEIGYYSLKLQSRFLHFENKESITRDLLATPSHIAHMLLQKIPPCLLTVDYSSILGAIQAVSLLNNLELNDGTKLQVYDSKKRNGTSCSRNTGLGNPNIRGALAPMILDIDALQKLKRYIPFDLMDQSILSSSIIDNTIPSKCWRCKQQYKLLGVDRKLGYIAGKCNCDYNSTLVISNNNPYKWKYDNGFTRLVSGRAGPSGTLVDLVIWHEPFKAKYTDALDYGRIVLPLLEEEWNVSEIIFKHDFAFVGKLMTLTFIEHGAAKQFNVYGAEILVKKTDTWNIENISTVNDLSLFINLRGRNNQYKSCTVKGKFCRAEEWMDPTTVRVYVNMSCKKGWVPMLSSTMEIRPQLKKNAYINQKTIIRQMMRYEIEQQLEALSSKQYHKKFIEIAKLEEQLQELNKNDCNEDNCDDFAKIVNSHPFMEMFIPKSKDIDYWKLPAGKIPNNPNPPKNIKDLIVQLHSVLNEKQALATNVAISNSVSVIHGPPGCGKTFMVSNFVFERFLCEGGLIILTASSHEAVDNLVKEVIERFRESSTPISLIRILAKHGENWNELLGKVNKDGVVAGDLFPYLHKLVKLHPDFNKPEVFEVLKKMQTGNNHTLTLDQKKKWKAHIDRLENEVLSRFRIIACTLATAMDSRLQAFAKKRLVSTFVVEEAGQFTHPETIGITYFNPVRILLVGDPDQLPATLKSQSAERAGFAKSQLELSANSASADPSCLKRPLVPYTTLNIQYRMEPAICKIVSNLFYRGKLVDADEIKYQTRYYPLPRRFLQDFREIRASSVVFYNKRGVETEVGTSILNAPEATEVVKLVKRILSHHVNPDHIVILTLYDAQKTEIINQLNHHCLLPVRVMTVDGFQGGEAPIVIVSLVRSNRHNSIGFANNPNRINVALSRAMFNLFVVGDKMLFERFGSALWKEFMLLANRYGITINR